MDTALQPDPYEGSTRLWAAHRLEMGAALERHDEIFDGAVQAAGGVVFKHTGDGILARFESAGAALEAAVQAQRGLLAQLWGPLGMLRARIGIHEIGRAHV